MPTDEAQPVPLPPDTWPNGDLWIQLDAHLEVTLQLRYWDRIGMAHLCATLEAAIDHGVQISFLGRLGWGCLHRSTVDGFVEDRVVRIVLFHRAQVVGTLEQVLALTGSVFGAHGLAVDALRGETLRERKRVLVFIFRQEHAICVLRDGGAQQAGRYVGGRKWMESHLPYQSPLRGTRHRRHGRRRHLFSPSWEMP